MDDKYQQMIEALAAKLGTTAEHLWGVLVRQAPITGAVDLAICVVLAALTAWWVSVVNRKTQAVNVMYGGRQMSDHRLNVEITLTVNEE